MTSTTRQSVPAATSKIVSTCQSVPRHNAAHAATIAEPARRKA
jgi:hypothetical protein